MEDGPRRQFPDEIAAGLDFSAVLILPRYPALVWLVTAIIRGPSSIDLDAVGLDQAHTFSAAADVTETWGAGLYRYSVRATNGASLVEVSSGELTVIPDLAQATAGYDGRSDAEIALDALDAVIGNRATLDQSRYRINNRELFRMQVSELLKLRAYYVSRVRRERAKKNGRARFGRIIPVRF